MSKWNGSGEVVEWLFLLVVLIFVAPYLLTMIFGNTSAFLDANQQRDLRVNPGLMADYELSGAIHKLGGF
jgi:hypothetical protein